VTKSVFFIPPKLVSILILQQPNNYLGSQGVFWLFFIKQPFLVIVIPVRECCMDPSTTSGHGKGNALGGLAGVLHYGCQVVVNSHLGIL
jgi:hypothetical protein